MRICFKRWFIIVNYILLFPNKTYIWKESLETNLDNIILQQKFKVSIM